MIINRMFSSRGIDLWVREVEGDTEDTACTGDFSSMYNALDCIHSTEGDWGSGRHSPACPDPQALTGRCVRPLTRPSRGSGASSSSRPLSRAPHSKASMASVGNSPSTQSCSRSVSITATRRPSARAPKATSPRKSTLPQCLWILHPREKSRPWK